MEMTQLVRKQGKCSQLFEKCLDRLSLPLGYLGAPQRRICIKIEPEKDFFIGEEFQNKNRKKLD